MILKKYVTPKIKRINSIKSRCNTPVLHPPIRAYHVSFLNFVSHFKINSPTHNYFFLKTMKNQKKKHRRKPDLERGGKGEREPDGGFAATTVSHNNHFPTPHHITTKNKDKRNRLFSSTFS